MNAIPIDRFAASLTNPAAPTLDARPEPKTPPPRSAMIHPGPGFRVEIKISRPDPRIVELFAELEVADISDQLNRLFAPDAAIRCVSKPSHRLVGPACTVRVYPGDNLMVHKCLDVAAPGDVVVIDAHGSSLNAVLGDMISTKAKHRGIAGFVIDGYVRDIAAIRELDFPIFARGTTPIGPLHRGPGEINLPICCGGVVVQPGDIVVADDSGVVFVPRAHAEEIHRKLSDYLRKNAEYRSTLTAGTFSNTWVDDVLSGLGLRS
jgi:RraA family protein